MIDDLTAIIKDMAGQGIALSNPKIGFTDQGGRFLVKLGIEVVEGHKASARHKVKLRKLHNVHTYRKRKYGENWHTIIYSAGPSIVFQSKKYSFSLKPSRPSKEFLKTIGLSDNPESETLTRCIGAFEFGIKSNRKAYTNSALAMIKSVAAVAKGTKDKKVIVFANDLAMIAKVKLFSPAVSLNKEEIDALSKLAEVRFDLTNYIATLALGFLKTHQHRGAKYIEIAGSVFQIDDLITKVGVVGQSSAYADVAIKLIVAHKNNDRKEAANVILTFLTNLWAAAKLSRGNPVSTAVLTVSFSLGLDSSGGIIGIAEFALEKNHQAFNYLLSKRDSEGNNMFDVMADPFRAFGINR